MRTASLQQGGMDHTCKPRAFRGAWGWKILVPTLAVPIPSLRASLLPVVVLTLAEETSWGEKADFSGALLSLSLSPGPDSVLPARCGVSLGCQRSPGGSHVT